MFEENLTEYLSEITMYTIFNGCRVIFDPNSLFFPSFKKMSLNFSIITFLCILPFIYIILCIIVLLSLDFPSDFYKVISFMLVKVDIYTYTHKHIDTHAYLDLDTIIPRYIYIY